MKERLVTLLCALGALALFLTMFVQGEGRGLMGRSVPRPTTENRGGSGYHAAMVWLDSARIRSVSLRDRFDALPKRSGLAATGNVLIVTLPAATVFRTEEFRPLDRWVRAGNTLVVVAALADMPDWAFGRSALAPGDLNLLTGLEFETVKSRERRAKDAARAGSASGPAESAPALRDDDATDLSVRVSTAMRKLAEPQRATLVANRPHAYFTGVREAVALSDYPTQAWTVKVPYEAFFFALAHQKETGEGVLWTRPLGEGRIVVSGLGSIFTNRTLGLADNGRLLANIIGANLGPEGSVLFDDVHQGLSSAYDPAKFYRDRRLYITIGILCLLWLSWVLGGTRLRPPQTRWSAPRQTELVLATGGFLARVLTPAAAARRLFEHFLKRSPWEALERHSRVAPADITQLRDWYSRLDTRRRVPLVPLHNLLVRIHRQLNS